ncbi:hypothetical protein Hanom_Chr05g00410731 [Helianthus anomalus]
MSSNQRSKRVGLKRGCLVWVVRAYGLSLLLFLITGTELSNTSRVQVERLQIDCIKIRAMISSYCPTIPGLILLLNKYLLRPINLIYFD